VIVEVSIKVKFQEESSMKNRIFAAFTGFVFILNLAGFSQAYPAKKKANARQVNDLVALLPSSDAVVSLDAKRFFNDALPKLLSANQPMLADITAKLDEMQQKTGIDLRRFDLVAAGFATKTIGPKEVDFDPVIIARGNIPAGGLVAVAKVASNGTYKEEKIGDRTVYIFSVKEIADKKVATTGNSKISAAVDRTINGMTHDIALASWDANTLVFGSVARVRQTLNAKTHVDAELTGLLSKNTTTVASFAAKTPAGLSKFLPLDNDELGKTINSIRFLAGTMDLTEGKGVVNFMARTTSADQAQSLLDTLQGLQVIGKAFLGGAKGQDKEVYARMIDNAKFGRVVNEVTFDLAVPQSDIDILIGGIK
ncbi:MAG: hypothetical protein ACRD43_04250, partial [Pyrinomonadaceae bacterium]